MHVIAAAHIHALTTRLVFLVFSELNTIETREWRIWQGWSTDFSIFKYDPPI